MANDYSNIKNNFMYGFKNRKNNFYQNYKNYSNDLEDPIFTGFTLSINEQHSPLFSGGTTYTYTNDIKNQKKSDSQSSSGSGDLSSQIENKLASIDRQTDYASLSPIEKFNDNYRIGYGNQDNFTIDVIDYGATEYIYMVDKFLKKSTTSSASTTSTTKSRKDPTGTVSANNNSSVDNGDSDDSDDSDDSSELSNLKKEEKELAESVNKTLNDTYNDLYTVYQQLKTSYDEYNEKYKSLISDKSSKNNEKSALENLISIKNEASKHLTAYIKQMIQDVSDAKYKGTSVSDTYKTSNASNIESLYDRWASFIKQYGGSSSSLGIVEPTVEEINPDVSKFTELYSGEWGDNSFDTMNYLKASMHFQYILSIYFTKYNSNASTQIDNNVNSINDESKNILIAMYGKNSNGNPLDISNYTSDSLYGKMKEAESKLNELKNNPDATRLEEIRNSIDKLSSGITSSSSSSSQSEEVAITVDYSADATNDTTIYDDDDAPQSCLDMVSFLNGMRKITTGYPYIFQSVTGLDEAYKNYFKMDEPYQGSKDNKITINCYESVDMRISSMFNEYFNAVYDRQYKRERVPVNLRRFECSIFVHDIRNFRHALNLVTDGQFKEDTDKATSKILEIALNHLSAVEFKFFDCEILQEETGNIFESVNNADLGEQRMTNFTFKYGNCFINFLPFGDLKTYYKTSGDDGEIGNTTNITKSTSDDTTTKDNEQVSDFTQQEEKINTNINGKYPEYDGVSLIDDFENVNDDDYIETYEIDNSHIDLMSANEKYQHAMLNKTSARQGEEYYNELGNVEYDDGYEMSLIDVDYTNSMSANDLYQQAMLKVNSARQGEENKYNLGNVEYDDKFEQNEINQSKSVTKNETYQQRKIITANDKSNVYDSKSNVIDYAEYSNTLKKGIGNVNDDDETEFHSSMDDLLKDTKKKLPNQYVGDNVNDNDNEEFHSTIDFLLKSISASTGIPTEQVGDKLFENEDILYGRNTNNNIQKSITKKSDIQEPLSKNYNGTLDKIKEVTYKFDAYEIIDSEIQNINNSLFGDETTPGINDKKYGTSSTDYVSTSDDNNTSIGQIVETTDFQGETDSIKSTIIKTKSKSNKSIGSLNYTSEQNDSTSKLGLAYTDNSVTYNNNEIGSMNFNTELEGNTNEIGKLNNKIEKSGEFETEKIVQTNPTESKSPSDIGNAYSTTQINISSFKEIDNVYKHIPKSSNKINEIKSEDKINIQKSNNDKIGSLYQDIESIGITNNIGNTNEDVEKINEQQSLGKIKTDKINVTTLESIGNVYDTNNLKNKFEDLSDISFT